MKNQTTNRKFFSFDAGWCVKVLFVFEYENGLIEYGTFKTDGFASDKLYKDKKNFQVALSKAKKQYGQPVVQESDFEGYNYVSGWGHKYH